VFSAFSDNTNSICEIACSDKGREFAAVSVALTRVGRYEIIDLLGEGGMGRVYRARDTHLKRTVAVKVLPESALVDQDSLRRFEQEARATAALNHAGILAVYDVGVHEGAPYLVSELLEGTTLRARLEAGPIPVSKAFDFAIQVADALAAAHAKGIVHRDLKPENLFVSPDDRIKVLDFGLAKLTAASGIDQSRIDITGTVANAVLGTPSYMSPEQARGQPADHRADIFSFGCIFFEMLQGRRAFEGHTAADVIGSILKDSPRALTSSVERPMPPVLDSIVQRCLTKEPSGRFQSATDLSFALRAISTHGSTVSVPQPDVDRPAAPRSRRAITWGLAAALGVAALAAVIGVAGIFARRPEARPVTEFLVPPPAEEESFAPMALPGLLPTAPQVGLSPDGRQLAFVTMDSAGKRKLWIRSLDTSQPRLVQGAEGVASWPFWSPDSRHVVIAVGRGLLKVDTHNNTVERLFTLPEETPPVPFVTGSWRDDGTILFSIGGRTGLYRTSASGGTPQAVTKLDASRGDHYHSWPQLLPNGSFLFFVRTDNPDSNGMYAGRLDSGDVTKVLANPSRAVYANGHLLWAIEDRLVAQPFDVSGQRLSGQPITIVPSVFQGAGRTPGFWTSNNDALVYTSGDTRERQFRSFARSGSSLETLGPPGLYLTFDVSSDLSKVVTEVSKDITASYASLSIFDSARGVFAPLTLGDQHDSDPRFAPDGDVVFARNSKDSPGITRVSPASGRVSTLFPRGKLPVIWLEDVASDGGSVVYRSGANRDAWQLLQGSADSRRLTDAREPIEQVQLSPDGRWIAYNTAETGRSEVFVSSVPIGGERRQVSIAGGVQPTWRADGRELYYLGLDGGLYSLDVATGPSLGVGAPKLLFHSTLPVISAVVEQYRPSGDGQRFLFCLPLTSVRREPLRMLLNWPEKQTRAR
jgi:eukaryotic-like serine/threonine-protein kinase